MTAWERAHRFPLGAEIVLALATGSGTFVLAAVTLARTDAWLVAVFLGVGLLLGVIAIARFAGIAYAVPAAMAGMLAYDWFHLPPTHPLEVPDTANLVDLAVYLAVSVLVGELAEHAVRRAVAAERAHGEIADEQAALLRVATLVARGAPAHELFAAVAAEAGTLLDVHGIRIARFEDETELVHVAEWSKPGHDPPAYDRARLEGTSVSAEVLRAGHAARIDNYADLAVRAEFARGVDLKSVVGAPVVVEGRRWGVMIAWSGSGPLPGDTEGRLTHFAELVATAISNTDARTGIARLADEQAALRRVATLVAHAAPPQEAFAAVAEEVGRLLEVDLTVLGRYDPDGAVTAVGLWSGTGDAVPLADTRARLGGHNAATLVYRTRRPARIDDYAAASGPGADIAREWGFRSAVGVPINVEGRLWGVMCVASTSAQPLPAAAEGRLAGFTELVATAIANTQARVELRGFAEEQAALRRVATLVARAAPPEEVFAAVTTQVGRVLSADITVLVRYDPDGAETTVGVWSSTGASPVPVGTRARPGGRNVTTLVFRTGRPARIDDYADTTGEIGEASREVGIRASIGVPISVADRLWGVMIVASTRAEPLPVDTEYRLAGFTELVATAIANAESQGQLTASRARIVAAADLARRRIERDLHDGAQQRLVSLAMQLRATRAAMPPEAGELSARLDSLVGEATSAMDELRELARGIHPAILAEGGLRPALKTLARRCTVPVELDVHVDERLPERIEIAAYYVVAEALTNAAKHAHASIVHVVVDARCTALIVHVRDDGRGGADLVGGSGLVGLQDRVEALNGRLSVQSAAGVGTCVQVELPLCIAGRHGADGTS